MTTNCKGLDDAKENIEKDNVFSQMLPANLIYERPANMSSLLKIFDPALSSINFLFLGVQNCAAFIFVFSGPYST